MDASGNVDRQAWPCHIAAWLPLPKTLGASPLPPAKTAIPGHWLVSKSRDGEILRIENVRGASFIKISAGGLDLLLAPLSSSTFCFALLSDVLLVGSAADSNGSYVFASRFMSHQHALECAALLKAAVSTTPPPPPVAASPAYYDAPQERQVQHLLMKTVASDPEQAGAAWWRDFPQLVAELEREWPR